MYSEKLYEDIRKLVSKFGSYTCHDDEGLILLPSVMLNGATKIDTAAIYIQAFEDTYLVGAIYNNFVVSNENSVELNFFVENVNVKTAGKQPNLFFERNLVSCFRKYNYPNNVLGGPLAIYGALLHVVDFMAKLSGLVYDVANGTKTAAAAFEEVKDMEF